MYTAALYCEVCVFHLGVPLKNNCTIFGEIFNLTLHHTKPVLFPAKVCENVHSAYNLTPASSDRRQLNNHALQLVSSTNRE